MGIVGSVCFSCDFLALWSIIAKEVRSFVPKIKCHRVQHTERKLAERKNTNTHTPRKSSSWIKNSPSTSCISIDPSYYLKVGPFEIWLQRDTPQSPPWKLAMGRWGHPIFPSHPTEEGIFPPWTGCEPPLLTFPDEWHWGSGEGRKKFAQFKRTQVQCDRSLLGDKWESGEGGRGTLLLVAVKAGTSKQWWRLQRRQKGDMSPTPCASMWLGGEG